MTIKRKCSIPSLLICLSLIISCTLLSSCRKSNPTVLYTTYREFEFYSTKEIIPPPEYSDDDLDYKRGAFVNDELVFPAISFSGSTESVVIYRFTPQGDFVSRSIPEIIPMDHEQYCYTYIDPKGDINVISELIDSGISSGNSTRLCIRRFDPNCTLTGNTIILTEELWFNDFPIYFDSEDHIFMLFPGVVYTYDRKGGLLFSLTEEKEKKVIFRKGIVINGIPCVAAESEKGLNYYPIDTINNCLGTAIDLSVAENGSEELFGCPDGLFGTNGIGVYAYDFSKKALVPLLLWSNSTDPILNRYDSIRSNNPVTVLSGSVILYENKILIPDPSGESNKKTITVAGYWLNDLSELTSAVKTFNASNTEYVVEIRDYLTECSVDPSINENTDIFEEALRRLNLDIINGTGPDILICGDSLPFESYQNNGVFTDIQPLMDQDPNFNINEYFENILTIRETNEKLFLIPTRFRITGMATQKSFVGMRDGWTIQEFDQLARNLPSGVRMLQNPSTQTEMLSEIVRVHFDRLVDWKAGTVNFNDDVFFDCLRFAQSYGRNDIDGEVETLSEISPVRLEAIISLYGYIEIRDRYGDDFAFLGWPCENRDGILGTSDYFLAIMEDSDQKDGAWLFIKEMLGNESQTAAVNCGEPVNYFLPLRKSVLEDEFAFLKYSAEKEYPFSTERQEHITAFYSELLSIIENIDDGNPGYNPEIESILTDEATLFFAGEKTLAETSEIINDRLSIYVSEHK